jgi:hypothetical protein
MFDRNPTCARKQRLAGREKRLKGSSGDALKDVSATTARTRRALTG